MTPIKSSKNSNEEIVYNNLKDKSENQKPKFDLGQLVRTADNEKVFSKGDSTKWSYKLYIFTEIIYDTIPSYRSDYLPERYNEHLLLPTKLSLEENNHIMKKVFLFE